MIDNDYYYNTAMHIIMHYVLRGPRPSQKYSYKISKIILLDRDRENS